ncbi:MAG: thiamine pyrophosphate-binding protein [Betaproteobacteria bacterium]|nr:thiamine pyrophosphate-binding protein [Betaproteobacteria bacterium]
MLSLITPQTGGQLVVKALLTHGTRTVYCVPGESYLPVLDALYEARDQIRLVVCRQEGGAANMAEAFGKLTGEPGICMVTRGPGASNAAIGLHTAYQDSTPMILLIGQVGSDFVEREAFQEVDYRRMFGQSAKWVAQIDRADRVEEMMSHAFHLATSGRPGPVVLALPEDMLTAQAAPLMLSRYQRVAASPSAAQMAQFQELIVNGKRPLAMLGGSGWTAKACGEMLSWAEKNAVALCTSFRCQDLVPNQHPLYVGHAGIGIAPALAEMIREADPLIAIGPRLGEMTTAGYSLIRAPKPDQRLIHVHAGAEELGRVYQADLMINSGMPEFAEMLSSMPSLPSNLDAKRWAEQGRSQFEADTQPTPTSLSWDLAAVVTMLQAQLGDQTIVANGAGNYTGWVHRYWRYGGFRTQLAPTSGAMGYGVPAAIAAKLEYPDRHVVCFAGDGCFLMTGQEFATAVQYHANVLIFVVNNGMYGTIRMHQEREYPERVWGTDLVNPDFAALARAYGGHGETVRQTAEFLPAVNRAIESQKPAIIELIVDPEQITSRTTIQKIRAKN